MSTILQFRMLSDEDDYFLRDYEVPYDLSLSDFHDFICSDLRYEKETMVSFFTADKEWNKLREFTSVDMDIDANDASNAPGSMSETRLSEIMHRLHDRLIYQFDLLGNRAYYLEVVDTSEADSGKSYPNLLLANGEAPDQFDADAPTGNRSIFDEAMGDFNEFEGNESYGDDE